MIKTDYYEIAKQKLKYFRYSDNTIKTYLSAIEEFLNTIGVAPTRLNSQHFQEYLNSYKFTSTSQQNQVISALKFLYSKVLNKKYVKVDFQRPRKERPLPRVVDKEQMVTNLSKIYNLKHRTILTLTYGTGLRISELINLKIEDIDSARMLIHIRNSKFNKDRYVPFSKDLLVLLRLYVRKYRPSIYVFNGQNILQYSRTSCQKISRKYLGTNFHTLRHSYATALLESGTNLRIVQKLLGHKSSKTTEIYTHVSNDILRHVETPV